VAVSGSGAHAHLTARCAHADSQLVCCRVWAAWQIRARLLNTGDSVAVQLSVQSETSVHLWVCASFSASGDAAIP
jgi:hypothetical protein